MTTARAVAISGFIKDFKGVTLDAVPVLSAPVWPLTRSGRLSELTQTRVRKTTTAAYKLAAFVVLALSLARQQL